MNPRLAAVGGPLKGMIFTLDEEETLVGRESSNRLCLGDRIKIGNFQFLFLLDDADVPIKSTHVQFDDRRLSAETTIQVRVEDTLYLMARDLSALMKISTTINSIRGLEELQRRLLELIFEVVPAERGAILLKGE